MMNLAPRMQVLPGVRVWDTSGDEEFTIGVMVDVRGWSTALLAVGMLSEERSAGSFPCSSVTALSR